MPIICAGFFLSLPEVAKTSWMSIIKATVRASACFASSESKILPTIIDSANCTPAFFKILASPGSPSINFRLTFFKVGPSGKSYKRTLIHFQNIAKIDGQFWRSSEGNIIRNGEKNVAEDAQSLIFRDSRMYCAVLVRSQNTASQDLWVNWGWLSR